MTATVTPIIPEVGFLGTGDVYLARSTRDPEKVYLVVHVGTLWSCSCLATGDCIHLRRARKIGEGL